MKLQPILLLLALFGSACRADLELPPNTEEPPHFSVIYNADTLAQQATVAGVADVYLFTDYGTGSDDVVTCRGTFADVQCQTDTCFGRLSLEFRNTQNGAVVLADSAFGLGDHPFKTNHPPSGATVYRTAFQADTTLDYTDFHWTFNGQYFAQGNAAHFDFDNPDPVRVVLQAARNSGPNSTVERQVSLETPGSPFPSVDILISPQANYYRLEALSSGAAITDILWSNGLTQAIFSRDSLDPAYTVTVADAWANSASARLEGLPTDPGTSQRTANFTSTVTVLTLPPDSLQLGTIALQWTDHFGQIWRSDRGPQALGASFQVLETQHYELNEQGQKTWQMQVSFVCRLYNDTGESIPFSGEGHIAVAYP